MVQYLIFAEWYVEMKSSAVLPVCRALCFCSAHVKASCILFTVELCLVTGYVCIQLKFLEVSHLSFIAGLGPKLKEGTVEKRAGGRRVALHCCACSACCQPPGRWQKR